MRHFSPCMDSVTAFYSSHKTLFKGIIVAYVGITVLRWVMAAASRCRRNKRRERYPTDTVILHQIGRGPYAPSMTPFAVKLETYLRMAKIPYQNEHSMEKSSKQKFPWITYNGEDVADSAFCIEFLNIKRSVDLNSWLTQEQCAVALALQRLTEDSLYWVLVVTRWVNEVDSAFIQKAFEGRISPLVVRLFMTPKCRQAAWMQGMGRHSQEEIRHIARRDLTALSDFLGNKKFLMGDMPCEQDCAIFGMLSQLYWHLPGSFTTMFREEFPQLVSYCERMKAQFWPDWDKCITHGGTVPATA